VQKFVLTENIHRFESMLMTEADPVRRSMIERLLQEERAKLLGSVAHPPTDGVNLPPEPQA
jgi:hypothetical protein